MGSRILIVEDEIFVAIEIEHVVEQLGHVAIGIAPDKGAALRHAGKFDVALVDLNLRDGPTGVEIGQTLARDHGATVLFMTANPAQLGDGISDTLGVIAKPVADSELRQAISFAVARHHGQDADAPMRMKRFDIMSAAGNPDTHA